MSLLSRIVSGLPRLGRFNEIPAGMIDRAYLTEPPNLFGQLISFIKIRAIYLFMFLPLSVIDMFSGAALALVFALRSFFTSDETQDKIIAKQKEYAAIFSRNFYTLLASIFGLFSPKITAFYFTPEQKSSTGATAGGNYHHAKQAVIVEPETIEELQKIVKDAAAAGKKIMPMGAGRSQGKQFLPEGDEELIVIDLKKLNDVVIDRSKKEATVGAGAHWSDIQQEANKGKLALKVMQASNVFSVGGSIGTNIHGWDHINGMLSNTITSIEIVNAQGELQTLTPDDELFHYITGGVGLFGIIVKATLKLTDNEFLKEYSENITPEDYAAHFHAKVIADDTHRMHLYRLSLDPANLLSSGVAVSYVRTNGKAVKTPGLHMEADKGTRYDRVMVNLARRFEFIRGKYWKTERDRLLANNGPAMSTNEIMQPAINAMFNPSVSESEWLQEYFLPEEQLATFLKKLGSILMTNEVALLNATVRFVKKNDRSPLSYAYDGDKFAIVLCFNQSLKEEAIIQARKWLREAQHTAIEHGGTYYLPYQHVSSPEDFNRAYPHAQQATQMKDKVDPEHRFVSGLYQKYMAAKPAKVNHFKVIMASAASKAKFAGFLKSVLHRLDSELFFNLLEDILKYCDSHEEIYKELCHRLPEIAPNAIKDLRHTLDSLAAIKADLAAQAHTLLPATRTTINGLVEVGYPGRFVNGFKEHYKVTGEIIAVYEEQSITDYIQAGFPRPYDSFERLDYSKPNLKNIKDSSADVITCYVGLHHFDEQGLHHFLTEVRRVLSPYGRFLLVDHDVTDDETMSMAHMAHTVFNAVTGVSLKEELSEIREFHSMDYWKTILAKHGLGYAIEGPDVAMIRSEDPSRNRMVSFKPTPALQLQAADMPAPAVVSATAKPASSASLNGPGRNSVFAQPVSSNQVSDNQPGLKP